VSKKIRLCCVDCKKSWKVDPDVPLGKLIEQGIIPSDHLWTCTGDLKPALRHMTEEDYEDKYTEEGY